jgi:hypothetical protein
MQSEDVMTKDVATALIESLTTMDGSLLGRSNIADAIFEVALQIGRVADALQSLGVAAASTPFGALELLSLEVKEGTTRMADAIAELKS